MNKLSKFFKAIRLIAAKPALLNRVLDDADVNRDEVIRKYQLPKGLPVVSFPAVAGTNKIIVEPYAAMEGGSTPLDLALLNASAASKPDCSYFEIGTWRGESAANVARSAKKVTTLNLPDESLLKMGLDKNYVALHRFFSKNLPNVEHVFGNSLSFDYSAHHGKHDLIFIDGDHHYESVRSDTENAFKMLKDDSSVIVWHDYGHDPSDIRWDVLRGILDGTPPEKRKFLYRVENTLCAVYTKQPLNGKFPKPFSDPEHWFRIEVQSTEY